VSSVRSAPVDEAWSGRVAAYLARVEEHDARGARELVLGALTAAGNGLDVVIQELLVPAMVEVGARWYDGRWTTAQEHVASGVTDTALSAASVRARRRPADAAPRAVLVCAHGDSHVLPARFAAELFVEAGADVILLAPSVPDEDLGSFLQQTRPAALVVSCTDPLALPGARASIAAAHRVGAPVLAGGAALGADDRRARALGADGWGRRPVDVLPLLQQWSRQPPVLAADVPDDREAATLLRLRDVFYDGALAELAERTGELSGLRETQLEQVRTDLRSLVGAVATCLLVGDDRLFHEYVAWSRGLLAARGWRAEALDDAIGAVDGSLGPDFPGAHRLLAEAVGGR
jgi:methanogenic corrinoid protein MtbC1